MANKIGVFSSGPPYFTHQRPCGWCGCYYPDVVNIEEGGHGFHCQKHGWQYKDHPGPDSLIPTQEWREEERNRLRQLHTGVQVAGAEK